jgi:cytochrome c peroxidase
VPARTNLRKSSDWANWLYKYTELSLNRDQSCETCHDLTRSRGPEGKKFPAPGFVDTQNTRNLTPVPEGSVDGLFGSLNTPSAGYAAFSPHFYWDAAEGLFVGGQFWNGRSPTLTDQSQPFLNPVEMAMPGKWAVVDRFKENPKSLRLFNRVYDIDLEQIPGYFGLAPASVTPPAGVLAAYDRMAKATSAKFVFPRPNSPRT